MNTITTDAALAQMLAVLKEVFEGPSPPATYVTDPDGGLFQVLDTLSAAEASRVVGNNSVAGQVCHVAFGLKASALWISKQPLDLDWNQSWAISTVDEAGWQRLKADLRAAYAELRQAVERHGVGSEEAFGGAVGAAGHAAYHLGAVRQKVAVIRKG